MCGVGKPKIPTSPFNPVGDSVTGAPSITQGGGTPVFTPQIGPDPTPAPEVHSGEPAFLPKAEAVAPVIEAAMPTATNPTDIAAMKRKRLKNLRLGLASTIKTSAQGLGDTANTLAPAAAAASAGKMKLGE